MFQLDENYSDKACVVFADSNVLNEHGSAFLTINGTINHALRPATENGSKRSGFVFPKKKLAEVKGVLARLATSAGATTTAAPVAPPRPTAAALPSAISQDEFVLSLLNMVKTLSSRVEALESEVGALRKLVVGGGSVACASKPDDAMDCDDDIEEEDEAPQPKVSLIKRKK